VLNYLGSEKSHRQVRAAADIMYRRNIEKMKAAYDKNVKVQLFQTGDHVALKIPTKDREALDKPRLYALPVMPRGI
jgi:hypothetical protein